MTLVQKIIHDPDTESLIKKYLTAGVMIRGKYEETKLGTPQVEIYHHFYQILC